MTLRFGVPDKGGPENRIGPNAITRVIEALTTLEDPATARRVLRYARMEHYHHHPPVAMVPEERVTTLQMALVAILGGSRARAVSQRAGVLTGDYLLRHRIPPWLQPALKRLPSRLASRILLNAIVRHAWTFCGSGVLSTRHTMPVELSIHNCPLCRGSQAADPMCDYYAGTFLRLFQELVARSVTVSEVACHANGSKACVFQLRW